MLTVSFTNPHPPYQAPRRYWEMYEDAELPIPNYPADMDEKYSDFDQAFIRWYGLDRNDIQDPKDLMAMRRGFAALAHYVDDKLGELLDVLDEQGLRENTVVIVTSDHGEMLGEKGLIQKRSFYEWSVRIPLIIDYPGAEPAAVDTPVSLIDLPATLIEIAGQTPARALEGRSLMPAIRGEALEVIPVISEYHGEGIMRPSFMVRLGPWKYIYCHDSAPQLFNIDEDPGEWENHAGTPAAKPVEDQLNAIITSGQFDLDFIAKDVWDRLGQKQVVNAAMELNKTTWDYAVAQNASQQYVRK